MRPGSLTCLVALVVSATASAAPRRFDLLTYTPPPGWKVDEKAEVASVSRVSDDAYCFVAVYPSRPAQGDLAASFTAEWNGLVLRAVDAVDAPTPTLATLGNVRAAMGGASTTLGGQPVAAILLVLEAGPRVMPILILTPSTEKFEQFSDEVQAMVASFSMSAPVAPAVAPDGKLVVPPPTRALTLADLAGEWGHEDGITTTYVDRHTGAYAGFDSLHFRNKWTISAKGTVTNDFFAIRNGKKIIEKTSGPIRISGRVLDIKIGGQPKYWVRGWLEGPELTVLLLTGPFYGEIPEDIRNNPAQGANLNQHWVRRTKREK